MTRGSLLVAAVVMSGWSQTKEERGESGPWHAAWHVPPVVISTDSVVAAKPGK